MCDDPVVTEALRAFESDLDYATELVNQYVAGGALPPAERPALVEWGSPPRFVTALPPAAPGDEDFPGGG